MVFTSPVFLFLFLPAVLACAFVARRSVRLQNVALLLFSLLFYAWGETVYLLLLLVAIGLTHLCGSALSRAGRFRGVALASGITLNLAILGYYKYAHFLLEPLSVLWPSIAPKLAPIHLPIGLSFFTFQAISYLVDLYRGHATFRPSPLRLALYISLFPQLLAGPIVRYADIEAELDARAASRADVAEGIRRFGGGLAKKVLVADPLAVLVDRLFDAQGLPDAAAAAWLGAMCFTLQIYFDFSGYSDMAIGLGRVFGFHFRENFDFPYRAASVRDFWHRWHISLSTWFRDYLYIPLGGSRDGALRTVLNLWIVFLLCGLWHGASMVFVVWGMWHGALLSSERLVAGRLRPPAILGRAYTLLSVILGFTLFRCTSLNHAIGYLATMFGAGAGAMPSASASEFSTLLDPHTTLVILLGWVLALDLPRRLRDRLPSQIAATHWGPVRDFGTATLLLASMVAVAATTFRPFVYFRF